MRQLGAILLLLVFCVAPAMACMAPDAQMTREERACCRMMGNKCGQMQMSSSSDCCKHTQADDRDKALKTNTATLDRAASVLAPVSALELPATLGAGSGRVQRPGHSPPKPPAPAITVLRV
jgi:hypothetical protein